MRMETKEKDKKHGYIDRDGYFRSNGRSVHRFIWEKHNGPIPKGMHIHHIDGNKLNNEIENLQMVDSLTHAKIHSGCKMIDGEWWRPCKDCLELKKESSDFYKNSRQVYFVCKKCWDLRVDARQERIKKQILNGYPDGSIIVFRDGNRHNTSPENIWVTDKFTRALFFAGGKEIDGKWWKPCTACGELKMMEIDFHKRRNGAGGYSSRCKQCQAKYVKSLYANKDLMNKND